MKDFDWNHARAFHVTAETGSFSAAARVLGQTQPTVGRQIAALETALGVLLFERVGKRLVLTPTGAALTRHIAAMQTAADEAGLAASGLSHAIEGRVAITASDVFSALLLPEMLVPLRRAAPGLVIEIVAANDLRDLQRREADIAIRHVRPTEPNLVARKLCESTGHFYAAPGYLDARGRPETTADLATHDIIGFDDPERFIGYMAALDIALTPDQFPFLCESGLVCWELAKAGLGITVMDDGVAARTEGMERVLPARAITYPVWLTTHRELHTSARIRLVFDHIAGVFRRGPP
ncbi:MAG: LysR family transcriptional regulator [Pseudomonadota bacterium]